MTELALILGIQGAALAYAFLVGRGIFLGEAATQRLRRLESALQRATSGFVGQQGRIAAVGSLLAAVTLFTLHVLGDPRGPHLSPTRAGFAAGSLVLAGTALALLGAYVTLRLNLRASVHVATLASGGLDRALRLAVRAGGAGGLFCEAASVLALVAAFGLIFTVNGGTSLPPAESLALARQVTTVLTGFPLGAAIATLVLARAGGAYHVAATLGVNLAGTRNVAVGLEDPRNPALVSGVAGDHLAEGVTRAALLFAMASAAHVAVLALGLAAMERDALASLALPLLPLVARSLFLLASMFAFSAVRTEELASASSAVVRGHVSATVIGLGGMLGACFWLERGNFGRLFAAGAVASLTAIVIGLPVWAQLLRRRSSVREAGEHAQTDGFPALSSVSNGLQTAFFPTLALGIGAGLVWHLGRSTELPSGGLWASLLGWAALFGAAPFAHAVSSVAALGSAARGTAALARLDADAQRGTERLDETHIAAASARAQVIAAGTGTALLCALAIPVLGGGGDVTAVALLEPAVTWCGALGVALVFAYAGSSARSGVRGAREIASELERQLRGLPREGGVIRFPREFSPSYKTCVDLSARSALRGLAPQALAALAVPLLIAFGLQLSFRSATESLALRGITSFVLFAALTAFAVASAVDAARATLAFVQRLARTQMLADPRPYSTTAGLAGLLGSSAAPAAHAVMVATAAVGLSLAPFLKS